MKNLINRIRRDPQVFRVEETSTLVTVYLKIPISTFNNPDVIELKKFRAVIVTSAVNG